MKKLPVRDINIDDYNYDLPAERIAQHPVDIRDTSLLLVSDGERISKDIFRNIADYIPKGSLLVFNNTQVIRARLLFRKDSGALVEILCLEPVSPFDYSISFSSREPVKWKCIIGNLKKWKSGKLLTTFSFAGEDHKLSAEKLRPEGDAWIIKFTWSCRELSFGEVIETTGHVPLPPYIIREDDEEDITRYQTVYSRIKGSVAAPTAGLHFTELVFENLVKKGIKSAEVTLHVGAGTFQPVKSRNISGHQMHCEHFFVEARTIKLLIQNLGHIIPVGTTSVRTLESLYWLGVKLIQYPSMPTTQLSLGQWEAYNLRTDISARQALEALLNVPESNDQTLLHASTSIIIIPGYSFMMTDGMVTNFHQPRSTLLLLISAWTGIKWKKIYDYALEYGFRFLSYGDSSLLLRYK